MSVRRSYEVVNGACKYGDMEHFKKEMAKFQAEGKEVKVEYVERFEFYERAKKCYAVIATGYACICVVMGSETSQYANIILQKGVITKPDYCFVF